MTAERLKVTDVLLNEEHNQSTIKSILIECLGSEYSSLTSSNKLFRWIHFHKLRGHLIEIFQSKIGLLINSGIEKPDLENPLHLISALHPKRNVRLTAVKLARKLDINITEVCNFKCKYCYQHSRDENWEERANDTAKTQLSAEKLSGLLNDATNIGVTKVKFTGGEPFANPFFLEVFEAAYKNQKFEEVEIVSNLSLLYGKRLEQLKEIVGTGKRLHIHLSIDGHNPNVSLKNKEKIFSQERFAELKEIFLKDFKDAVVSVNTMWTKNFTSEESYIGVYNFLHEVKPKLWSISLPYLVKDIVDYIKIDEEFVPDFDKIISVSNHLLNTHQENKFPFALSIPLVYKHEINGEGYSLSIDQSEDTLIQHPCFPCHGSYFIVGPYGSIFDCLLLSKSEVNYAEQTLVEILKSYGEKNEWYEMTVDSVSKDCVGCRFEKMCKGQCPNDRYNAGNGNFGRDKSACSLLVRAENEIWNQLPAEEKAKLKTLINATGFTPATYESIASIIKGESPITKDLNNKNLSVAEETPVKIAFHHA